MLGGVLQVLMHLQEQDMHRVDQGLEGGLEGDALGPDTVGVLDVDEDVIDAVVMHAHALERGVVVDVGDVEA